MAVSTFQYQNITKGISLLFIVLFVYVATSKLLELEVFKTQLGRSPYISTYTDWLVWGVPLVEYIISAVLLFPKYRLIGLYLCFTTMTLFTCYIYFVLSFSDYIPCSCGGIISSLDWNEHLILNIFFMVLAFIGIIISHKHHAYRP